MKNENMKGLDVKISDRIARLSEEKRALLLERLKKTGISQKNKIPKRNGTEEAIPLSFAQERLWFLSQLVPEGAAYSEAGAIELAGKLNVAALERALREIVLRHEILRTTFVAQENGCVQQMIAAEFDVKIKYINLDVLSPEHQLDQITQGVSNEVRQPFNLSSGPLIRFTLFQLNDEKHILLAGLHHIIADAWSIRLLIKELSTIYSAFCSGAPSPLDNLSIQYADYAYWQRDWLKGTGFNEQLVYWMRQLKGCSSLLELPIDMPRPALLKNLGARYFFNIPSEVTADLNQVAKMHGATMFMTLMATFAILLNRYTQQHDICIGYPIANRSRLETQELIGFFANTLVLRTDCSGNPSFSEFLGRTRTACLAAQTNQDLPFEKLVEELAPVRDMRHHPLFQVMFILQNANLEKLELPGVKLNEIEVDTGNAKFDLTLSIKEVNGELKGCFEYSTELFYETTIARWATHYRKLLQEITTKFDKPLSDLVILPEEERKQILDRWNDTAAEYSHDQCIHQLIENQVRKEPNAIAIVIEDQQITYDQLNKSASQLAHYLRAQGIGAESRVGIFTERSIEMIIGILAILKAGGAYVPIDPRYPKEHITHVIEDAMLQHVLIQEKFQALIPAQMKRFLLDAQWDEISDQKLDSLESIVFPGNLAYVIYTSGSTGKPKGVGVTHRNVVHSTLARLNYYQEPVDGFLLLPSIAFDSSVAGIFGTLCQGGRLVLVSEEAILDPIALSDLILHQQISHLLTIPSLYEAILQKLTGAGKHLKSIIVAGEPCKKSLIDLHYACLPQVELFNEYGPTEATVWSSVHRCQINEDAVIPIGRPIANTCIYLLDAYLNPVSVGITGELYIGGAGLVRGYLNRADVTAEYYIPDPFGNPGNRLYRTGDLARYRDNGNIEYVGRVDHQVKIRGFRVELGEIENILLQDSQIKDAVVVVREDTLGNQRLVAYVVGALPTHEIDGIRTKLKEHLPDHMVPAAFVFLDQLPLTPNGKIDRKALPDTDIDVQIAIQYVAPRTDLEDIVANIWAEVLRVERVGIFDNFFELGGHSLLIAQVISRIRQVFAIELPMRILFAKPFVSELAVAIDVERTQGKKCPINSLESVARSLILPLSYAQERLWFLDQFEPGSTSYNMPGAVRLTGELDVKLLERSLNEIIRRHEVLRTTFRTVDGEPEQIIAPSLDLEIVSIDLRGLSAERRESKIQHHLEEDTQKPFDLAQGPLVRASLLCLGETEHILLFTLHHIISDGWSIAILVREFITLYEAYRAGLASPLPELTIQYADYAIWQREWLQGERLEQQISYWKQHLADAPAILELPADRPRPLVQSYRGATLYATVPQSVTEQLKQLGRQQDATLFMVLLTAFNILLSRYSGQHDLCVGTPVANRNRLEIEGLIGFFINTLVLRTDLSGNPTFMELLKRVKEICLGAQAHQDLPFEKLVEELSPVRDMSHNPLFQVMLALQNTPETALEITGLKIAPEMMEVGTSKFDLDLEITESEQGLEIQYSYNTDLFDRSTIERFAAHYGLLLESIIATPNGLISELPLLTEAERNQLLTQWNGAEAAYPSKLCIHQLFEEQAVKNPDAIAVVFERKQLTYGALNQKSNQLAHFLRAQGVGPEVLVGICVERSLEMMVGILGILKAGGAYLPIEPELPDGKLRQILQDAGVHWVLTSSTLAGKIPKSYHTLFLDQEINAEYPTEAIPNVLFNPQQLAYMLYTSGTTGIPKGVGVAHGNLVNQYYAWKTSYELDSADVHLQMARYTFDVFAGDWVRTLCSGGKLVICPRETLLQPTELYALMQSEHVTVAEFVPAVLRALAEYLDETQQSMAFMSLLICGSDRWYIEEYKRFLKLCGQSTRLINSYGLTEATIDSTYYESKTGKSLIQELVPIGQQFANTHSYILDRWLNLVPIGVPGELYIGGAGVVRGYFNRPELTAERFIPDLFNQKTGERLYKTGDVVRYLPDGNIEHLGRTDHQVKIRGLRIELGEIEATLLQHAHIREAVVVARSEGTLGNLRLVAYVVGNEAELSIDGLRSYLKEYLVDYMIPSVIVLLEQLPLNANGKVDRKALPEPDMDAQCVDRYVAPRTETEEKIAAIWADVLKLDKVGIHDNFFQLGGHSLLVMQIVSRIQAQFQTKLAVRTVFEAATVDALAEAVEIARWVDLNDQSERLYNALDYEDIAI